MSKKFYHYKMVPSNLWNTFIPSTMKSEKDYIDEINHQLTKTIPEQIEDLKRAVAQFCVAVDRYIKDVE